MANEIKLRASGVSGALSAAFSGTTMSSAGLADLPVVDTTNFAVITLFRLDANGRVTKKEIVYVTAHTSAATTATVLKGQEGTTDQSDWTTGDRWVHGSTPADFSPNELMHDYGTVTGATSLFDTSEFTMHRVTLGAAAITLTLPAPGVGKSLTVEINQDATGSRALTLATPSGAIQWAGGTTPTWSTAASKRDVVTFVCIGGTNWIGSALLDVH